MRHQVAGAFTTLPRCLLAVRADFILRSFTAARAHDLPGWLLDLVDTGKLRIMADHVAETGGKKLVWDRRHWILMDEDTGQLGRVATENFTRIYGPHPGNRDEDTVWASDKTGMRA